MNCKNFGLEQKIATRSKCGANIDNGVDMALEGKNIKMATVTGGHLILTFTDSTTLDCGQVVGADGNASEGNRLLDDRFNIERQVFFKDANNTNYIKNQI